MPVVCGKRINQGLSEIFTFLQWNCIRLVLFPNLLKLNIIVHMKKLKIFLLSFLLLQILARSPLISEVNDKYPEEGSYLKFSLIETGLQPQQKLQNSKLHEEAHEDQSVGPHDQSNSDNKEHQKHEEGQGHGYYTPSDPQFWQNCLLALLCTITGAFCSGMTVGFLSISTMELEMMVMKKNPQEAKMAERILKVVTDHHLFLVTLLVANAVALESLPIVVHSLMPDWAAILFSTIIVLVVAEIIPQSYCTGEKKIILAYYASPVVQVMIKVLWIIVYPMGKGLDWMLGTHDHQRIQRSDFAVFLNDDKTLKPTEKLLLTSTLELRTERVQDIMIGTNDFFMLEEKQMITPALAKQIKAQDYSYVLIYKEKKSRVIGVLKVKEFAVKYVRDGRTELSAVELMKPNANMLTVYSDTNLLQMLMLFQAKSTRIALICSLKKKTDPRIESIMYSKSDMVYSNSGAKDVEVVGVVYLYQIFEQLTRLKSRIERESQAPSRQQIQRVEQELTTLNRPLLGEQSH